ncbi:hypothetical protein, partial [Paraburkholderia sp. RL18-085-BIA-A]
KDRSAQRSPAPVSTTWHRVRSASLHQQQRSGIMNALFRFVNNIFVLSLKKLLTLQPLVSAAALVRKREAE